MCLELDISHSTIFWWGERGSVDFIWLFRLRGKWQHSGASHHATWYSVVLHMKMLVTLATGTSATVTWAGGSFCLSQRVFFEYSHYLNMPQLCLGVSLSFLEVCWVMFWWPMDGEFWSVAGLMASGCLVAPPALRATGSFQSALWTQGWGLMGGLFAFFLGGPYHLFKQVGKNSHVQWYQGSTLHLILIK